MNNQQIPLNEYGNYTSSDQKYQDGIINPDVYGKNNSPRILWILKETSKDSFSIKNYFENFSKFGFNSWKTWKNVAITSFYILKGLEYKDEELPAIFNKIAIINLKKTAGKASTNMKKFSKNYLAESNEKQRKIITEQITRIKPDVIICGNVLQLLDKQLTFREAKYKIPISNMEKKNMYCFDNIVFINAYHPCYPTRMSNVISSDTYCKSIKEAYDTWQNLKTEKTLSHFEF